MADSTPPRHMTPDEVLHALRHFAQINSNTPLTLPGMERITPAATIAEYDWVRDSDGDLGRFLSDCLGCEISDAEWQTALSPAGERTVGELCEFLSGRVTITPVQTFRILDRPCLPAGIFLTLKARLAARGVSVQGLSPSTRIDRYAWNYPAYLDILREAALIAPHRLPLSTPAGAGQLLGCGKLVGCGLFVVFLGLFPFGIPLAGAGVMFGSIGLIAVFFLAFSLACFRGWNHFPGIRTFRDLCKALAGEPIARPQRT